MYKTILEHISSRISDITHKLDNVLISEDKRKRLLEEIKKLIKMRMNYKKIMGIKDNDG